MTAHHHPTSARPPAQGRLRKVRRRVLRRATATTLALAAAPLGAAAAFSPLADGASATDSLQTVRVSVSTTGVQGNRYSYWSSMSANGSRVAFGSLASTLVPGDTNGREDVFVRDLVTGTTQRVSTSAQGAQANHDSYAPALSADGRYVAFMSYASNLVPSDTNNTADVFRKDLATGAIQRVSLTDTGSEADVMSTAPVAISRHGEQVAFTSDATNLVAGDTNGEGDVFVRDLVAGTTERVSVGTAGQQADGWSQLGVQGISADGRFVVFDSYASDLVPGDRNGLRDVYLRDRVTRTTRRITLPTASSPAAGRGWGPSVSANGRFVVFVAPDRARDPEANGWPDVFIRDRMLGTTERVSVDSDGAQGHGGEVADARVSADGRFVAFSSEAIGWGPGSFDWGWNAYVRDRAAGTTEIVAVDPSGGPANGGSFAESISRDGRYVAFGSGATNLVAGDTNGVRDCFVRDLMP